MQAKKEKRFKPQKQKAVIQPDLHFENHELENALSEEFALNRPANTFFDDLEQVSLQSPRCLLTYRVSMSKAERWQNRKAKSACFAKYAQENQGTWSQTCVWGFEIP